MHTYQLIRAGASNTVRELFDSSLRAGRYALENMGLTDLEANKIEHFFYRKDREAIRELADLWDPMIPVANIKSYVERSKELHADLETALVSHLDEGASASQVSESVKTPESEGIRKQRKSSPGHSDAS